MAQASLVLHTIDADLAAITYDSDLDPDRLAVVRGGQSARLLTFETPDIAVEIESEVVGTRRRLVGQLIPAQTAELEVRHLRGVPDHHCGRRDGSVRRLRRASGAGQRVGPGWRAGGHDGVPYRLVRRLTTGNHPANAERAGATEVAVVLEIHDLRVTVATPDGPAAIVRGVSLSLGEGRILGIVGESGSGKSATALDDSRAASPGRHCHRIRAVPGPRPAGTDPAKSCAGCGAPGSRSSPRTPPARSTLPSPSGTRSPRACGCTTRK